MKILGRSHGDIITAVERVVAEMKDVLVNEKHQGNRDSGYFTIFDSLGSNRAIMLLCEIGVCPQEKRTKYFTFSQEKATRLSQHSIHLTSWESRDPDKDMYGGAIRIGPAGNLIISFSGLPELADEAVMLYVAVQLGWLRTDRAIQRALISNNEYLQKLVGP